jgi:hypothetical protein
MAIIKTLDPAGVLVAANGVHVPSDIAQVVEDIVDAVNATTGVSATDVFGAPSFTIGAQVSTHRDVTIQLTDSLGDNIAAVSPCIVWLSTAALGAGDAVTGAAISVITGTIVSVDSFAAAGQGALHVLSDETGVVVIRMTYTTGSSTLTQRCNVISGAHAVASAAVTVTNA